jgi:hypothetical protein
MSRGWVNKASGVASGILRVEGALTMQATEQLTFGSTGTVRSLNSTGLDFNERGASSWTIAAQCEIDLQIPVPRQDVTLLIDATPFTSPGHVDAQQVFLYINGLFHQFTTFEKRKTWSVPVMRNAVSPRPTKITMVLPNATSPKKLGLGNDERSLGLALHSLSIGAPS